VTYPTLSVQVAFGDDPLATSWTWTDVTSYVKRIRVTLGRDRELDDFEAGRAIVVFDNTDRRFDPEHASGPYFGNLLPSKRIRIRATHSAVTYTLFHGYVDDWPQDYSGAWTSDVVVPCTDAFGQLARATLPSSVYAAEVLADDPWGWWRMQEEAGDTWADSSGNEHEMSSVSPQASADYFQAAPVVDESAVSIGTVFGSDFPGANIPAGFAVDGAISVEVWTRTGNATYVDTVQVALFSAGDFSISAGDGSTSGRRKRLLMESGGAGTKSYTNADVVNDGNWHHVVVRLSSVGVVTVYVDGVLRAVTTTGALTVPSRAAFYIENAGFATVGGVNQTRAAQMAEVAVYEGSLSGARCLAHYNAGVAPWDGDTTGARIDRVLDAIGWPSALRYTEAGLTSLGPAHLDSQNALAYMRAIANGEQGQFYCAMHSEGDVAFLDRHSRLTATRSTTSQYTYSDEDTTGVVHYETIDLKRDGRDVINEVVVKWAGGEATVSNAASQTTYGLKSLSIATELGSRIEAENLGEWIMGRYSVPVARCRGLTLDAAVNADAMTAALDTRINDRVSIRRLPNMTGDPIELDVIVEGVEHDIDNGVNTWTTTLRTSQADAGPWWIPDVGIPDTSTRPAW
jgi:hypothetical protein